VWVAGKVGKGGGGMIPCQDFQIAWSGMTILSTASLNCFDLCKWVPSCVQLDFAGK
jgi:hypothetical protein